jgi:hypothetical protein
MEHLLQDMKSLRFSYKVFMGKAFLLLHTVLFTGEDYWTEVCS